MLAMSAPDIRWLQRYEHFLKAHEQLKEGIELAARRSLSKLEQQGLIQAFEFTHELAWKTLKDFLENRGAENLYGSKDVTRAAFKAGLIDDGEIWMDMIVSRNATTHTYDEAVAERIRAAICGRYAPQFRLLETRLRDLRGTENP